MKHKTKKVLFFVGFLALASLLALPSSDAKKAKSPDYKFYKKNGHRSRQWNKEVEAGFIAFDQGNCPLTLSHLKQAIAKRCQDPLVYYKLALCTEYSGSLYTAVQYYQLAEESLKLLSRPHPYQIELYENYGRALYQAGKPEQALEYLKQADALAKPSFGLYVLLGTLLEKQGQQAAAINYYEKALEQSETDISPQGKAAINLKLAVYYHGQKKSQLALDKAQVVLSLEPNNPKAQDIQSKSQQALSQANFLKNLENFSQRQDREGSQKNQPKKELPAVQQLPPLE